MSLVYFNHLIENEGQLDFYCLSYVLFSNLINQLSWKPEVSLNQNWITFKRFVDYEIQNFLSYTIGTVIEQTKPNENKSEW